MRGGGPATTSTGPQWDTRRHAAGSFSIIVGAGTAVKHGPHQRLRVELAHYAAGCEPRLREKHRPGQTTARRHAIPERGLAPTHSSATTRKHTRHPIYTPTPHPHPDTTPPTDTCPRTHARRLRAVQRLAGRRHHLKKLSFEGHGLRNSAMAALGPKGRRLRAVWWTSSRGKVNRMSQRPY